MTPSRRNALPLTTSEVEQRVVAFFGCEAKAARWLSRPKHALDGLTPRQAAERGRGAEIIQLIEQAEHGFVL